MKKNPLLKLVCNVDMIIASIAMIVLTIVTAVGVFMRYVVKNPILWQEEVCAFCQVWMIFMGASVAFRQGSIVAIEMLTETLPEKAQEIVGYVVDILVLFTLTFLLVKSQAYITQVFGASGRPTPILRIPYSILYGIAPYGCALMIVSYFLQKYLPGLCKELSIGDAEPAEEVTK